VKNEISPLLTLSWKKIFMASSEKIRYSSPLWKKSFRRPCVVL